MTSACVVQWRHRVWSSWWSRWRMWTTTHRGSVSRCTRWAFWRRPTARRHWRVSGRRTATPAATPSSHTASAAATTQVAHPVIARSHTCGQHRNTTVNTTTQHLIVVWCVTCVAWMLLHRPVPVRLFKKHTVSCTSRWNVAIIEIRREVDLATNHDHFNVKKSDGGFNSFVKGSQFEYDSRHWRNNIHVAPLADNQTFSAVTERSILTTR